MKEWQEFLVMELGPEDVVLGLPWLRSTNPAIDWAKGTMKVENALTNPNVRLHKGRNVEQVAANRAQRHRWWRAEVLEDPLEWL